MALPAVARLDFSGFVEGKTCMSYKHLFASETPLLKGSDLCPFLQQLDQEEYQLIRQENGTLVAEQQSLQNALENVRKREQSYWSRWKCVSVVFSILTFFGAMYSVWKIGRIEKIKDVLWSKIRRDDPPRPYIEASRATWEKYEYDHYEVTHRFDSEFKTSNQSIEHHDWRARFLGGLSALCGLGSGVCALNQRTVTPKTAIGLKDLEIAGERELRILDKIHRIEVRVKAIQDEAEIQQLDRARNYFSQFKPTRNGDIVVHQHVHY